MRIGALLIFLLVTLIDYKVADAQIKLNVVSASRPQTDTLYFNVENRVSLTGLRSGDSVRLGNSCFRADGDTVLSWRIAMVGESKQRFEDLLIFRKRKRVLHKRFVFRDPGKMIAALAGLPGMDATLEQIQKAGELKLYYPGSDFKEEHYIVKSFQMATYSKSNLTSLTTSNSAVLIPEQLSILKQLQVGERIKFRKIVAGCEGCVPVNLADVIVDIE